jgi:hypothetical protein
MKLIDLSLNLNLSILKNKGILKLRLLEDAEEEEVKKIKELLNNGIEIYKRMIFEDIDSNNYDTEKSTYDSTESNIMIFQSFTGKEKSKNQYKQQTIDNKLGYADYTECITDNAENKLFIVLNIPTEIANVNLGEASSYSVLIKAYDITKETNVDITKCENIMIHFPLPNNINLINYSNFKKNNIDIYNPEDDAFKKICYTNTKLKEDYPFNYRKTKIYSQKKFEGLNDVCSYKEIDVENKMVIMKCKYSENGFGYKYADNKLKEEKTNNVPLKCFSSLIKSFKKLNKGATIIGLLLFSMFFSLIASKCCCCKEKEDKVIPKNDIESQNNNIDSIEEIKEENNDADQIYIHKKYEDIEKGKKKNKKKKNNNIDRSDTNQSLKKENKKKDNKISFCSIFCQTFLKSHP